MVSRKRQKGPRWRRPSCRGSTSKGLPDAAGTTAAELLLGKGQKHTETEDRASKGSTTSSWNGHWGLLIHPPSAPHQHSQPLTLSPSSLLRTGQWRQAAPLWGLKIIWCYFLFFLDPNCKLRLSPRCPLEDAVWLSLSADSRATLSKAALSSFIEEVYYLQY